MKMNNFIAKLYDWFKGDINREGEKQMEAFTQQDPFAKESLEGFHTFPEGKHKETLQKLRQQIQQKENKKSGFYWMRIAASIVIILALGSTLWLVNSPLANQKTSALAEAESPAKEIIETSPKAYSPLPSVTPSNAKKSSKRKAEQKKDIKVVKPVKANKSTDRSRLETIKEKRNTSIVSKDTPTPKPTDYNADSKSFETDEIAIVEAPTTIEQEDIASSSEPVPILVDGIPLGEAEATDVSQFFNGVVMSIDKKPLDGVKITSLGGISATTLTNVNGRFVIEYTSGMKQLILETKYFQPLSIPITGPDDITLHLTKLTALSDTEDPTKQFTPAKKRTAVSTDTSNSTVEPTEGYDDFGRTISQSIHYPEEAKRKGIEGDVELSFIILSNGQISNIRILTSPNELLSAEAIRLFTSLPKWINTTGKSRILTYSIPFKIK